MKFFTATCILAVALLLSSVIQAKEESPSRVILVLDASGSMWGQIKGKPKIDIARGVIQQLLKDLKPGTQLGLTVYGHRHKGDCADIEHLIPAARVNASSFMDKVNAINPKGKTPMTAAVKQAAEVLKYSEESATVILVSDGEETCNLDPCAAAKELEKLGVDLTVHVVGFDVAAKNQKAMSQLRCMAKNTGGDFFQAGDAAGLQQALSKAVKKAEAPVTGLQMLARMKSGSTPLERDLSWNVYEAKTDQLGKRKRVTYSYHATPLFRLTPGSYWVTVKYGAASAGKEFTVKADQVNKGELLFNAGRIQASATMKEGGQSLTRDLSWEVHQAQADSSGKRKRVTYSYNAKPVFSLAEGRYLISVKHGSAKGSKEVEVKADSVVPVTLVLGAGQLRAQAVLTEGGEPVAQNLSWEVHEAQTDQLGKRKRVTYSYNAKPVFKLPTGKYLVSVKRGSASVNKEVAVKANELTDITLTFNAGRLQASTSLAANSPMLERDLSWEVHELKDGKVGKRITYSYNKQPLFVLAAGDYRVSVKQGTAKAAKDVAVAGGATQQIAIPLNAGHIQIRAVTKSGGPSVAQGLSWEVYEATGGKRVTYSYSKEPLFVLMAGNYRIKVKSNSGSGETSINVKAGEVKGAEVVVKK